MSDVLRLSTLGGLSIHKNSDPVAGFISRKVEALLIYLAHEGREHPREVLAEMLWNDLPQERALANLRTVLSSLQAQLAPFLTVTRQTIGMNPDSNYWLDVNTLEIAINSTKRRWSSGLTDSDVEQLTQALTLYRGDFLAGFYIREAQGFDAWRAQLQEHVRQQVIEALSLLIKRASEQNAFTDGIDLARWLLRIDPLLESTHRHLMLMLARSGQRTAALAQFETCRRVLEEELGVKPEDETLQLNERIQQENLAEVSSSVPMVTRPAKTTTAEIAALQRRIPLPSTPFIDRPHELTRILERLKRADCRLLTIVGQGGIGKTRLAIEAATQADSFVDGVYFIPLATLQSEEFLISLIADAADIKLAGKDNLKDQVFAQVKHKHMLLVMDNFEHVMEAGSAFVSALLQASQHLKVMVTSRERLNLQIEQVVVLGGMEYPLSDTIFTAEPETFPSVQLFLQGAQRVAPDFNPTSADWSPIARICRLVEGMPLGIELASSWVQVLTPKEIAQEIEQNLDFLATPLSDVPERHRSVRAVFEYTWGQLSDAERDAFARLSIFRGGFTREAAQKIAGAWPQTLLLLMNKALLKRDNDGRYIMHELLRQYAQQRLAEAADEYVAVQAKHCAFYANLLYDSEHRHWNISRQQFMAEEAGQELENVRVAWDYALDHAPDDEVRKFLLSLFNFFAFFNRFREGVDLFHQAGERLRRRGVALDNLLLAELIMYEGIFLKNMAYVNEAQTVLDSTWPTIERNGTLLDLSNFTNAYAGVAYTRGDYVTAYDWYMRRLDVDRRLHQAAGEANTLAHLGDIAIVQGDYEKAYGLLSEALSINRRIDSAWGASNTLAPLGDVAYKLGQYEQARRYFQESLALSQPTGEKRSTAVALVNLGRTLTALGHHSEALRYCQDSLTIFESTNNRWGMSFAYAHLGRVCFASGDLDGAKRHYQKAASICNAIHNRWVLAFTLRQMSKLELTQGDPRLAKQNAIEALTLAKEIGAKPLILDTLVAVGSALCYVGLGNNNESALIGGMCSLLSAAQHPISEYDTRTEAEVLIAEISPRLSPHVTDAIKIQSSTLTLEQVVDAAIQS